VSPASSPQPAADDGFVACTVASRRFIGQARVLADSFFEHHPDGRFAVLVPDDPDRERSVDERVEELRPSDIGFDDVELHRMALHYSVKELACAMKAPLLRHIVKGGQTGLLLDADACIYGDLSPFAVRTREAGLVLTPHCLTPHGTPDRYPPLGGQAPRMRNAFGPDQMMIRTGTYNSGIVGATVAAEPFLEWWTARTARYCLSDQERTLFQEQGWTALAPTLFDCHILREPGWNASGFHLHDGDIDWSDDRPRIAGALLRFFHFIAFDPSQPDELTSSEALAGVWPASTDRPGAVRLCRAYAERLWAAGHAEALADTSPYERLGDGTPVDPQMRVAYGEALLQHEAGRGPAPPNPFHDGDDEGFVGWLEEPVEGPPGTPPVSRYLLAVHTRLPWVWGSFKELPGQDGERFLAWLPDAVRVGDLDLPERWVPEPPPPPEDPVAILEDRYSDLLEVIDSFRTSRSWRLTAPLRTAGSLARRRRASPRA
jgi:hypothetical protein